jgi:hypothetical protein
LHLEDVGEKAKKEVLKGKKNFISSYLNDSCSK